MKYLSVVFLLFLVACNHKVPDSNSIVEECRRLKPLTRAKHTVQQGEWLESHAEAHESLKAYCSRKPTAATARRSTLYVVRLGAFDARALTILEQTKNYLQAFFQIPVAELAPVDIKVIAPQYLRANVFGPQIKTAVLLDSLLPSLLPDSAFALIAFSLYDLYPNEQWNYVFGQASLERRVGAWSLARLGDYSRDDALYKQCLLRTIHVAVHETGHMFGMTHCVQNECCLNGSNSLEESDNQPLWLCWECQAKICVNRKIDPLKPIAALYALHRMMTPGDTATGYYRHALQLLKKK
jgi:archaemetzincin